MEIKIDAIKFNHTPGTIDTGALNIRKNFANAITAPEWTPVKTGKAAKAAYSIHDTSRKTITVQAKFTCDTPGAEVKIRTQGGGHMGNVVETDVTMGPDYITFSLAGTDFDSLGVDILDVKWQWQYQAEGDNGWTDAAGTTTDFTVYTLLSQSGAPWSHANNSADTQLPWTDVLDWVCIWAKGSKTADEVQAAITTAIFQLGEALHPLIKYDTVTGDSYYSYPDFKCTAFLERLNGGFGRGQLVNCSDCATIVSSFTNILGCELWQSRMEKNFDLRTLRAIGTTNFAVPFNGKFSYHEVAWKDACTVDTNVYDACLELNTNRGSGAPVGLLPVDMKFGICYTLTDYRANLTVAGATGCDVCVPKPATTRKRRSVI
ncbi:hypothetical protein KXD93_10775 [Mucilaginibacter sp. BJC16-A38]|uniref:hypothetical protein n=1 Tax=Mucilaginibacter phenanthrenivorans TaxID=1234842 RepID=UPI00215814B4|nr:hypothetical protein [Mucilaginibacter phenanthrenivorans]MCR8558131.1 hypothetical protein [Mucilaginibacter phenanthrenivorans]